MFDSFFPWTERQRGLTEKCQLEQRRIWVGSWTDKSPLAPWRVMSCQRNVSRCKRQSLSCLRTVS
jgi:hypothetical protein